MSGGPAKLIFEDGQREAHIPIEIKDDDITEGEEQFEVGITIQNAAGNGGVEIGSPNR